MSERDMDISPEKIKRRIYVGKLSAVMEESHLNNHFSKYGPVEDVFIMRFPDSGKSKLFGFVTFEKKESVAEVLDAAPHSIDGVPVEVKQAVPKGESDNEKSKAYRDMHSDSKIFVGRLKLDTTKEDLHEYFSNFGNVIDSMVVMDNFTKKSRGFGFVTFESVEDMDKVLDMKDDLSIKDTKIEVTHAQPKKGQKRGRDEDNEEIIEGEHEQLRKVYVGCLSFDTKEAAVREYFEKYGELEQCEIQVNKVTGKSRGMAFVTFKKASSVDACQADDAHRLDGRNLDVKRPIPAGYSTRDPEYLTKTERLWVGGTYGISDEDIKEYFEKFGDVKDVHQPTTSLGKSRGFAYLTLNRADTVDKICLINRHVINDKKVFVKKGLKRNELMNLKYEREAKFARMGSSDRGFGRGGASSGGFGRGGGGARRDRSGDTISDIKNKLDLIFENMAELNQLTSGQAAMLMEDKMFGGSGGGGFSMGNSGGYGMGNSGGYGMGNSGGYGMGNSGGYGMGNSGGYNSGFGSSYGQGSSGGYGGGSRYGGGGSSRHGEGGRSGSRSDYGRRRW